MPAVNSPSGDCNRYASNYIDQPGIKKAAGLTSCNIQAAEKARPSVKANRESCGFCRMLLDIFCGPRRIKPSSNRQADSRLGKPPLFSPSKFKGTAAEREMAIKAHNNYVIKILPHAYKRDSKTKAYLIDKDGLVIFDVRK